MLTRLTIVVIFLGSFQGIQAQNFKFGKPELSELQATVCPIDSSADAYVIGEYGRTTFDIRENIFQVVHTCMVRIKILKKSALDRATHSIPYFKSSFSKQYIGLLKGYTYNLQDGKIIEEKLSKEAIFDEQTGKEYYKKKFTLPNVKEGSVIEYSYEIASNFYTIPTWNFQGTIPTLWSEYKVSVPEYFTYSVNTQGYEPFVVSNVSKGTQNLMFSNETESLTTTEYNFAVKNAPAIRDEAYITTIQDYVSEVTFELSRYDIPRQMSKTFSNTTEAIKNRLNEDEDFGLQIKKVGFLDDAITSINTKTKDTLERVVMAANYLKSNLKWNDEERVYTSDSPKKVFENHAGNSADLNLMLVGMLRKMKLSANPVLISTRDNGRVVASNPQLKNFNYVITMVEIGGNWLYIDITEPFLRTGSLPVRCLNQVGLMIGKEVADWVDIKPTERYTTTKMMTLSLNDEGQCSGKASIYESGYSAMSERKLVSISTKDKVEERIKKANSNWDIKKIEYVNADSVGKTFETNIEFSTSEGVNVAGNRIYFKPFLDEGFDKNPFQKPERKYPVNFGALTDQTIIANYTLPDGYVLEEVPKNEVIALPENGGRFVFMSQVTGNKLQITTKLNIKKPEFYTEEYPYLKEFFDKIVAKQTIQLVLVKK